MLRPVRTLVMSVSSSDIHIRFFAHYSDQVPIVDAASTPNGIYESSNFLFWAVITTGSRKYIDDTTIFNRLSQRIVNMALQNLVLRHSPFHLIQGLLLLCAWPVPVHHIYQETVHT